MIKKKFTFCAEENDTKEEYSDEVLSNGFFSLLVVKLLTLHGAKDKAVRLVNKQPIKFVRVAC